MAKDSNTIGALEHGFDVVDYLSEAGAARVVDVAAALDMPKSTAYTYLNTLRQVGYVITNRDGRYCLSTRFVEVGELTRQARDIYFKAQPEMDDLAASTGELVNLAVVEDDQVVYLTQSKGDDAIELDTYPGMRAPLYCTALGKVSLAFMDHERREDYLASCEFERLTENTITDEAELRSELEETRDKQYALDQGERAADLRCVAAPIVVDNHYRGAISVTAPVARMQGNRFTEDIPGRVVEAANVIQIRMTYS